MSPMKLEVERNRPYINPSIRNRINLSIKVRSNFEEKEEVPIYTIILLDNSGSMDGEPLQKAKEAAKALLQEMESRDAISVLSFSKDVRLIVPPSKVEQKAAIASSLDRIQAGSVTRMNDALVYVMNMLKTGKDPYRETRVILLSDGAPTDVKDPQKYSELVSSIRAMGVSVSTVGIGASDDRILRTISDAGGGAWTNVWSLEDLSSAFVRDFNRARSGRTQYLYMYPKEGVSIIEFNMFKPRPQKLEVIPTGEHGIFYSILPSLGEDLLLTMTIDISPRNIEGEVRVLDLSISSQKGKADGWAKVDLEFTTDEDLLAIRDKRVSAESLMASTYIDGQTAIDSGNRRLAEEVEETTRLIQEEYGEVMNEQEEGVTKVTQMVAKKVSQGSDLNDEERKKAQEKIRGGV